MTQVLIAAGVLIAGAALALLLRNNVHRAWAALASQAVATVLVESVAVPTLLEGTDWRGTLRWSYPAEAIAAHLDPLSAFFLSWSLPMTLLGTLYALGYLRPYFKTRNAGPQFALLNITSLSFLLIYTIETATVFLLGWEIAAVAAWLLVIWDYPNQKIRFAGFNYLVSTHVGFFVLVAAFMLMHAHTGSMDFEAFAQFLRAPSPLRGVTFVTLVVAFGLKSAFFPFHTWLPRAHSAAPAHVSALMSGVIHKAGLFGLLRFTLLMGQPEEWMGWALIAFSAHSAVIAVAYTTAQRDLKRLLGYSSTENVGIVGMGIGLGYLGLAWHRPALVALGFTGAILHIVNHAFFKCLLFYAAGSVYRATHLIDLERLGGLARKVPWTAAFFLLGGAAISGLPPFNGFVSELLLYAGFLNGGVPAGVERIALIIAAAVLALVGGISMLAMTRAFGVTFLGAPRDASVHAEADSSKSMRAAMAVCALGVVLVGLMPAAALRVIGPAAALFTRLLPGGGDVGAANALVASTVTPVNVAAGLFLGLLGALLLVRRMLAGSQPAPRHVTWGCGYTAVSPRMQYSGTSFSLQFVGVFEAVLKLLKRVKLPQGPFPAKGSHLNTTCVDSVEQKMFESLGHSENLARRIASLVSAEPTASFAVGLLALAAIAAVALARGGLP